MSLDLVLGILVQVWGELTVASAELRQDLDRGSSHFPILGTNNGRIWILPLDISDPDHPKPGKPELFLQTAGLVINPAFSPDGRWLAYASNEAGNYQVYVRPYPPATGGGQWQISTAGGAIPVWSRDGKQLFYRPADGRIMVVDYTTKGETFSPGTPRLWSGTPTLLSTRVLLYTFGHWYQFRKRGDKNGINEAHFVGWDRPRRFLSGVAVSCPCGSCGERGFKGSWVQPYPG